MTLSPLGAMLNGPFVGATRLKSGAVLHAAEGAEVARSILRDRKTADARCGVRVRLLAGDGTPVLWPPRISALRNDATLCPACKRKSERPRDTVPYVDLQLGGESL